MDINATVTVRVPRWTTEEVPLLELLVDRVIEIRQYTDNTVDLYVPTEQRGLLQRAGSITNLTTKDFELFDTDRKAFWIKNASKLTEEALSEVSIVYDRNWYA